LSLNRTGVGTKHYPKRVDEFALIETLRSLHQHVKMVWHEAIAKDVQMWPDMLFNFLNEITIVSVLVEDPLLVVAAVVDVEESAG
jgi:hypothetical protein